MDNRERKRWRERLRQQRELREERDAINAEILRACKSVRRLLKKLPDDEVLKIVWYYRGSSKPQKKNAKKHFKEMQKKLDKHFHGRLRIKKCFCEVWCGRSSLLHERPALKRAKEYADRYSLPLVAYSLDRFVRAEDSEARTGQFISLDWPDLKILKDYFGDTVIATLRSPIEDMRVTRGYASKSGQESTGNAGGRPKKAVPGEKKRLREKYAPVAYRLRLRKDANGKRIPYREIANILLKAHGIDVSFRTVYGWVKWYRERRKLMKKTT